MERRRPSLSLVLLLFGLVGVVLFLGYGTAWFGGVATTLSEDSSDGVPPDWARVSRVQIAEAEKRGVPVAFENHLGMRFVLIPAGTFWMGSPEDEPERGDDETRHEVTLSSPYYLQITEVTNAQFRRFRSDHDSDIREDLSLNAPDQPVVGLRLADVQAFIVWLSEQDRGRVYALPTEAQWEHACRAGTETAHWWGEDEGDGWRYANGTDVVTEELYGWAWSGFSVDDGYRHTAPVASYLPNPWGLYDVSGNVWEWCGDGQDDYPAEPVVDPIQEDVYGQAIRGGAWNHYRGDLRSAKRHRAIPEERGGNLGFRLLSPLPH